jgi:hypothetical protein
MIQYARLPVRIPIRQLKQEISSLTSSWYPHFNTKQYEGSWTVLSLRSPAGEIARIIPETRDGQCYADTSLMKACPTIEKLVDQLQCPVMAVRLMNLTAGSIIKEHRDHDLAFEKGEARLHIPVFTNPLVRFCVNRQQVLLREGECWYVNVNLPHSVTNQGIEDRVHLVIDCVVNDWLKELFAQGDVAEVPQQQETDTLVKTIHELRLQNTELTNRLADELEQKIAGKP